MVVLDIWYDQTPTDDEGNVVSRLNTAAELDALIDRIIGETADNVASPMIQVALSGVKRSPALEVGLGKDKGFVGYASQTEGGWAVGGGGDTMVDFVYMANHSEVPASADVAISTACCGLHEFLVARARPNVVESDVE